MHSNDRINDNRYAFVDFQEVLTSEFQGNADFQEELLTDMEQGKGMFTEKRKRYIWSSILNNSLEVDYVFVNINYPKNVLDSLIEVAVELKVEFERLINLFLDKELIVKEAKVFLETYESEEPISEEENVQILLDDEEKRLVQINQFQKMLKVININSDCSLSEIENKIWKEIKL